MTTHSSNKTFINTQEQELLIMEKTQLRHQLDRVNNKLLNSENLKTNFLSNIRNEINNPLASVLELSKSIVTGDFTTVQIKKFANLIHSEIFNLDFQLRNVLFSAEIEAGDIGISFASVNVCTITENIIESFIHVIEKKKLTIACVSIQNEDQLFNTDPEKLHLIISNVLANAIQFSNEGGTIKIEIAIVENQLQVTISDNGVGISEQNVKLIFDRFRQGEEGSTKNYAGHGLGLSVCKALLDLIDGVIEVESEQSKGSKFTIKVNEVPASDLTDLTFSTDGNDFLFNDSDAATF